MTLGINDLVDQAHGHALRSGFHDDLDRVLRDDEAKLAWFGLKLALIHSEVTEALEAARDGYPLSVNHQGGKDAMTGDLIKPEGVPSELADIVIRVADLCGALGIDLEEVIQEKVRFNSTRPPKHSKQF